MTQHSPRQTIVALFDDFRDSEGAVDELEAAGIPASHISLVANNLGSRYGRYRLLEEQRQAATQSSHGAGNGLAIGAATIGGIGLLATIGALTIPGVGPLIVAGSLGLALVGTGAGAAAGGLVGALVGAGVSRAHADIYAEAIRRGGTLIAVEADSGDYDRIAATIARHGPAEVERRGAGGDPIAAAVAGATTASGAPADHGASAGTLPNTTPMPTGSGALGSSGEWQVRREADIAAGREPAGSVAARSAARIRAYPAPESKS